MIVLLSILVDIHVHLHCISQAVKVHRMKIVYLTRTWFESHSSLCCCVTISRARCRALSTTRRDCSFARLDRTGHRLSLRFARVHRDRKLLASLDLVRFSFSMISSNLKKKEAIVTSETDEQIQR